MEKIDRLLGTLFFILLCLIWITLYIRHFTDPIETKINDLEEQNTKVHEYILNKIGG